MFIEHKHGHHSDLSFYIFAKATITLSIVRRIVFQYNAQIDNGEIVDNDS